MIVFDIEDTFGIEIPYNANEDVGDFKTVGSVVDKVKGFDGRRARRCQGIRRTARDLWAFETRKPGAPSLIRGTPGEDGRGSRALSAPQCM